MSASGDQLLGDYVFKRAWVGTLVVAALWSVNCGGSAMRAASSTTGGAPSASTSAASSSSGGTSSASASSSAGGSTSRASTTASSGSSGTGSSSSSSSSTGRPTTSGSSNGGHTSGGEACSVDAGLTGTEYAECVIPSDCACPLACASGICRQGCRGDSDCRVAGETCDVASGFCQADYCTVGISTALFASCAAGSTACGCPLRCVPDLAIGAWSSNVCERCGPDGGQCESIQGQCSAVDSGVVAQRGEACQSNSDCVCPSVCSTFDFHFGATAVCGMPCDPNAPGLAFASCSSGANFCGCPYQCVQDPNLSVGPNLGTCERCDDAGCQGLGGVCASADAGDLVRAGENCASEAQCVCPQTCAFYKGAGAPPVCGSYCSPDAGGAAGAACQTDVQCSCPLGCLDDAGVCGGTSCVADGGGAVGAACASAAQCGCPLTCVNGSCAIVTEYSPCSTDAQCGNLSCLGGLCEGRCVQDSDCAALSLNNDTCGSSGICGPSYCDPESLPALGNPGSETYYQCGASVANGCACPMYCVSDPLLNTAGAKTCEFCDDAGLNCKSPANTPSPAVGGGSLGTPCGTLAPCASGLVCTVGDGYPGFFYYALCEPSACLTDSSQCSN